MKENQWLIAAIDPVIGSPKSSIFADFYCRRVLLA
jgi:hypothetical protein